MKKQSITAVVSCLAAALVAWLAFGQRAPAQEAESSSPFRNVEILTHVESREEMRRLMKKQAAALGVRCSFCHVPGKFHLDDKEHKVVARDMMRMMGELNERWFPDADEPAVTCWTCHRGAEEPEHEVPAELLQRDDSMRPADGQ